jgi:hypothetical protein
MVSENQALIPNGDWTSTVFVRVCALTRQTERHGQYISRAGRASLKGTYAAGGAAGERDSVANLASVARLKRRHE